MGPAPRWIVVAVLLAWLSPAWGQDKTVEIKEYEGQKLSPFDRKYDNSIAGPQKVDPNEYRLKVNGLVEKELGLKYDEVLALPQAKRLIIMHCVEGWSERLLFEGPRLADIFALAKPKPTAKVVIFRAVDGYASAMPLEFIMTREIMLAAKVNGLTLDERRGFPFWLVAEDKLGYKWVKWIHWIQLDDKPYLGYWESKGYDDAADVPEARKKMK